MLYDLTKDQRKLATPKRSLPAADGAAMDCPICLREAKNVTPPTYRGVVVECPRCGIYRVTQDAIAALRTLRVDERLMAFRKAKMLLSSRTPTITSGCLGVTLPRKTQSRSRSASQPRMPVTQASPPPSSAPLAMAEMKSSLEVRDPEPTPPS
jgi:hypothetical protein